MVRLLSAALAAAAALVGVAPARGNYPRAPLVGCTAPGEQPLHPQDCNSCGVSGNVAVLDTGFGRVLGTKRDTVEEFLGIPYARGDRFKSPVPWDVQYGRGFLR